MADQAPQATLKANCRRMVVSYGIVAEVTGPSYRPTSTYLLHSLPSGIPAGISESGIPDQINLALE